MMKLYQIADQYLEALTSLYDADLPDEVVKDTLDSLKGTFESKAVSIASFIENIELETVALDTVINKLTNKRRALNSKINWLKDYLRIEMDKLQLTKIKSTELTISIKKNRGFVVIDDEKLLPDYFTEAVVTTKILKDEINRALVEGQQVPGAHLEKTERLEIL